MLLHGDMYMYKCTYVYKPGQAKPKNTNTLTVAKPKIKGISLYTL